MRDIFQEVADEFGISRREAKEYVMKAVYGDIDLAKLQKIQEILKKKSNTKPTVVTFEHIYGFLPTSVLDQKAAEYQESETLSLDFDLATALVRLDQIARTNPGPFRNTLITRFYECDFPRLYSYLTNERKQLVRGVREQ